MDLNHVTKFLIVAGLLALVASSPLPYGLKHYPQTSDWEDSIDSQNDVDRLRLLLALQRVDKHLFQQDTQPAPGQAMSKRFDFGFSGLDNIDHILSTLDRNEAIRPGGGTLKQQFISQGARSHDIDKLKKLMQSVG